MRVVARICCIALLGLAPGALAEAGDTPSGDAPTQGAEKKETDAQPVEREADRQVVYVPPSRGSARVRTGGGTRGPESGPTLAVLAPDHIGVTNRAQPSFAWFLSAQTSSRVDFTLVDPEEVEPLVEATLASPFEPGVHLVHLADLGVQLELGRSYDWSVALVVDPENRDLDVVASGAIRREPAAPEAQDAISAGMPAHVALARAGVWYDAMAELSAAIAAHPEDRELRAQRAALLEQVGVGAAAAYERESGLHGEARASE